MVAAGEADQASTVELVVIPGRLLITETRCAAAIRWDVRALVLSSLALAVHV